MKNPTFVKAGVIVLKMFIETSQIFKSAGVSVSESHNSCNMQHIHHSYTVHVDHEFQRDGSSSSLFQWNIHHNEDSCK